MGNREEMIAALKRQDMIDQLKADDARKAEGDATLAADKKYEETKPSALEAGMWGTAQGVMRNWGDEIAGGIASAMGRDGEAVKQNFRERAHRSEMDHPAAYGAGDFVGKVVPYTWGGSALATSPLSAAGVSGADAIAETYGKSEDKGSASTALDAGINGLVTGTGAGLVTKFAPAVGAKAAEYAGKGYNAVKNAIKPAANAVSEVTGAFHEGAQNAGMLSPVTGPLAAAKKVLEMGQGHVEQTKLANSFRNHLGPGHFRDMTDAEVIAQMVGEGNDQAIDFVAGRAGHLIGAPADEFKTLLMAGANKRSAARAFDFDQAGNELAPLVEGLGNDLRSAASARTGELNNAARAKFSPQEANPAEAITTLQNLVAKGREHPGTVGNVSYIEAANDILQNGSSTIKGLTKRPWTEIEPQEMYDRLQTARQYLGENVQFSNRANLPKAARESQDAYHSIGKVLKFDPDKAEGDAVWSGYKKIEDGFLNELKRDGAVDKYKVGNSLKDTQSAKRLRDNLGLLDEFLQHPDLDPALAGKVKAFRDKFADKLDTAELRRTLQKFESATVGSSRSGRAAQAAESLKRGDNLVGELTKAPEQALRAEEGAVKSAEQFFGKPFAQFSMDEKRQLIKFRTLLKKNPDLDFVNTVKGWNQSKPE